MTTFTSEAEASWTSEAGFELDSPFATSESIDAPHNELESEDELSVGNVMLARGRIAGAGVRCTVRVVGSKQGAFKGDPPNTAIEGTGYRFGVTIPRDVASGQARAKRRYDPIAFVHPLGASSPQFFTALVTNEILTTVRFELTRSDPSGAEVAYFAIELRNARVASLRQFFGASSSGAETATTTAVPLEEISLAFAGISLTSTDGKTDASDGSAGDKL